MYLCMSADVGSNLNVRRGPFERLYMNPYPLPKRARLSSSGTLPPIRLTTTPLLPIRHPQLTGILEYDRLSEYSYPTKENP